MNYDDNDGDHNNNNDNDNNDNNNNNDNNVDNNVDNNNHDNIKVADATCAVANVDDYSGSSRLLAATTLRNVYFVYLSL